jgi:hypothetical protein
MNQHSQMKNKKIILYHRIKKVFEFKLSLGGWEQYWKLGKAILFG